MVENNSKDLINNYKMTIIKSDILISWCFQFSRKTYGKRIRKE